MNFFSYLGYIVKNNTLLVFLMLAILLLGSAIETVSLLIIAPVIDFITGSQKTSGITNWFESFFLSMGFEFNLTILFATYFLIVALKSLFDICSMKLMLVIKYSVIKKIVFKTYGIIFNCGWHFFLKEKTGKLINSFTKEIDNVGDSLAFTGRLLADLIKLSVFIIIPLRISWEVTVISFSLGFLAAIPLFFFGKYIRKLGAAGTNTANEYVSSLQEDFSLAKIIIGFASQEKSKEILKLKFDKHVNATIKASTFGFLITNFYAPLAILGIIMIYYTGDYFMLSFSEIGVIFVTYYKIIPIIKDILNAKNSIDSSYPSYEQVINLQKRAIELTKNFGKNKFLNFKEEIKFENVDFSYENKNKIIKNLSLKIKKSEFVAFVGESGTGKSTIIDLIMGLNNPQKGKILIDGNLLENLDINLFRQKIGYIPQTGLLFNMSVLDNIRWANETASIEKIKEVCKQAYAHDFIENFENGYDTIVGERGVRLSGGQLQRISLARALIKNPDILILDEATSALDIKSEQYIQNTLKNIYHSKTIVAIAHRLSTIQKADKIFVIKDGSLKEEGNFNSLLKLNGLFKKMVDDQTFIV